MSLEPVPGTDDITDVINDESIDAGPDVEEESDGDVPDFGHGDQ